MQCLRAKGKEALAGPEVQASPSPHPGPDLDPDLGAQHAGQPR